MAAQPQMTWIGSPNFGYPQGSDGRNGHRPIAIVYHIMEGTLAGTDSWFNSTQSQVSAHFGVGKNGEIHQYVLTGDVAWGNGVVKSPTWPNLIAGVNPNLYTISIEHEGAHERDSAGKITAFWQPTEPQYQASLALSRWLVSALGITPDAESLIPHASIDSLDRANCPGPKFPFVRLLTDLGGAQWDPQAEMLRLAQRGIINGEHAPGDTVSWGELATVLNRLLDRN